MCAGHPNDVTPEGLRNLPFFLYMGGDDAAYNRNTVVREFSAKIDVLQAADPAGYVHRLTVYPGLPHNMQSREAEMIPRMSPLARASLAEARGVETERPRHCTPGFTGWNARPRRCSPTKSMPRASKGKPSPSKRPSTGSLTLRLSDALLDLDRPVRVVEGGRTLFEGAVPRSFAAVEQSLREREDPESVATALLPVSW